MRIALIGQAAFGADVLKGLLEHGQEVAGVFCPPDRGAKLDPLKEAALAAGLPVFQPGHMRDQEAYEAMVSLNADLGVLAFVTDIIPPRVFNAPKLGSICYHPSILPRYRGSSAINWAVINGEAQTGLTIFWVDQGIDTGDILLQKTVEIGPAETTGEVYFNKLYPLGVAAVLEAVDSDRPRARPPGFPRTTPRALMIRPATKGWPGWTGARRATRSSTSSGAATPSPGPPPPSGAKRSSSTTPPFWACRITPPPAKSWR